MTKAEWICTGLAVVESLAIICTIKTFKKANDKKMDGILAKYNCNTPEEALQKIAIEQVNRGRESL